MSIRHQRINMSTGVIEMTFPMPMSSEDVQDFKDAMAATFRVLERTATNGHSLGGEATGGRNLSGRDPIGKVL